MTDNPLESRPTADGEQWTIKELATELANYWYEDKKYTTNSRWQESYDEAERVLLHLIKQNTPSKESVVPTDTHTSKADDSSIPAVRDIDVPSKPDDTSLQSQPQQPESQLLAIVHRIVSGGYVGFGEEEQAVSELKQIIAQREQAAHNSAIDAAVQVIRSKQFEYAAELAERVKRLAPERQDSEGGL